MLAAWIAPNHCLLPAPSPVMCPGTQVPRATPALPALDLGLGAQARPARLRRSPWVEPPPGKHRTPHAQPPSDGPRVHRPPELVWTDRDAELRAVDLTTSKGAATASPAPKRGGDSSQAALLGRSEHGAAAPPLSFPPADATSPRRRAAFL